MPELAAAGFGQPLAHMFVYQSRFLTRGEVWFDEQPGSARVDWIHHRQRSGPLGGGRSKPFYTRLVDLRKPPADLLAEMDEKTARRIVEAEEKDRLRCEPCDGSDRKLIDEVGEMWNRFATAQHTSVMERPWIEQVSAAGAMELLAVRDTAGTLLTYHLVFLTPRRARQLIAISPYRAVPSVAWRNTVSRANSLAHWKNFLSFRERGIDSFDFGGWYPGATNIRLLGMNAFKKGFGGKVVCEFDCEQPVTARGRLALALARFLARLKPSREAGPANPESDERATQPDKHQVSPALR